MAAPQPPTPLGGISANTSLVEQQLEEHAQQSYAVDENAEKLDLSGAEPEVDRDAKITTLARSFSHISRQYSSSEATKEGVNTFLDPTTDPELDPNSDQFKSRKWVRNLLHVTSRDPDRYPRRTAGVSFRNLNVFGYGTAADYQMDVGNIWLKALGWFRSALGVGEKLRIDILRDFEGIVNTGDMLVVLGRPGRYVAISERQRNAVVDKELSVDAPPSSRPLQERLMACIWTKAQMSSMRVYHGTRCTAASGEK